MNYEDVKYNLMIGTYIRLNVFWWGWVTFGIKNRNCSSLLQILNFGGESLDEVCVVYSWVVLGMRMRIWLGTCTCLYHVSLLTCVSISYGCVRGHLYNTTRDISAFQRFKESISFDHNSIS